MNTVASRIAKNEKALQEYGVQIYDTNGDLKSTYDILKELSPEWEKMTKAEQVSLGTTLAGVNQYKVFSAVMTNFKTAIKATDDALNSEGSALQENAKYMESIQAKAQAVKNEIQEMILKSDLKKLIKSFLELANAVLKFQNAVGGLKPLLVGISGALLTFNIDKILVGFTKLSSLFKADVWKKIKTSFNDVGQALGKLASGQKVSIANTEADSTATKTNSVIKDENTASSLRQALANELGESSTQGAKAATDSYTLSLASLQTVMSVVTVMVTALVMAFSAYKQSQEEVRKNSIDLVNETGRYIKKTNEALIALNDENLTREELNSIVENNIDKYSDEINKIDDLNEARQRAIDKIKAEQDARAEETLYGSTEEIEKAYEQLYKNAGVVNPDGAWYNALVQNKRKEIPLKQAGAGRGGEETKKFYEDLQDIIRENGSATVKYGLFDIEYTTKDLDTIQKYWQEINSEVEENKELIDNANAVLRQQGKAIQEINGEYKTIDLSEALNVGDKYYGSDATQQIFQEITDAKNKWKLTEEQALEVKNHLSEYGYDVRKTVAGIFPEIVEKAQKAEDEIDAFVESFGLTADQVQAIRAKMAETGSDDFFSTASELYPELEDGVNNYTEAMKEASEEELRSQELLKELGVNENALQKEIGMSSTELIRQADAWNINETSLYNYLKALNQFDESLDNTQSAYGTLQTAIDEYNSTQGYSIDTMQALLRLSPEYLTMLDDELNGRKSLKDSITDKIKAQALEAKQEVYNMAIQRLQALTSKDSKNANDENASSFRNSVDDIDAQTEALNRNTKSIMQNSAFKSAVGAGKKKEAEQVVQEMQEQIDIIDKAMLSLGTDFSSAMGKDTSSTKGTNSALKEQNNLLKEQKQLLEEKKKQYDTVVAYIKKKIQDEIKKIEAEKKAQVDAIKEQIDALKDLKEEETNRIDEQIDKLKEQKEIEQTYWEEKIEAFKKQNEELEEQLEYEELLENLAKAKSKRVRVYKEGQGFVYTEDGNEVDKAQAEIDEYTRKKQYEDQLELLQSYKEKSEKNYEEQIKALEKLKDEKEKNYDEQIKALEKHQEEVEAAYDAQIAYFQGYLDKFTEQTDAYENETNRQLAIQLTGIDFEQQGWQKRLDNLANFVEKYNALLGDIHTLDTGGAVDTSSSGGSGSGGSGGGSGNSSGGYGSDSGSKEINKTLQANINSAVKSGMPTSAARSYGIAMTAEKKDADWYAKNYGGRRPSGDSSIPEDGMYLVGDSPNQELVIGSKLNGSLMSLSEGSGVVNATSTRTLAGVLNQLGLAGNQGINMSNSQNKSTNIQIGNISLPNVQNGKDFVDYLQNFSLQMTQEAFA